MNFKELCRVIEEKMQANPIWFEFDSDCIASNEDLCKAEEELGIKLNLDYCSFLKNYGGGMFAFMNVFSLDNTSRWNLVAQNRQIHSSGFLAISDDQTGGYFGYKVNSGICSAAIYYYDCDTSEIMETKYQSLNDYIAVAGLNYSI